MGLGEYLCPYRLEHFQLGCSVFAGCGFGLQRRPASTIPCIACFGLLVSQSPHWRVNRHTQTENALANGLDARGMSASWAPGIA